MTRTPSDWKPVYTITPRTARFLMEMETARAEVEHAIRRAASAPTD